MLMISGTFELDPADRDAFLAANEEGMRLSRAEAGCQLYAMAPDPIEPGLVHLIERWESKEALAAHLVELGKRPRADAPRPKGMEIQQYTISDVGPVGS